MTHFVFVIDDKFVYKRVAGDKREAEKKAAERYPGAKTIKFVGKSSNPTDRGWTIYDKWSKKIQATEEKAKEQANEGPGEKASPHPTKRDPKKEKSSKGADGKRRAARLQPAP